MTFNLYKINNVIVKPIQVNQPDPERIKGYKLFPEIFSNIFICAKKKSGKTNVIFKILKECCNKNTIVIIFSSTANKDPNMLEIINWLEKHEIENEVYTSLDDNLSNIINRIENDVDKEEEEKEEPEYKPQVVAFNETEEELTIKIKKRKPYKVAPDYFFIFDDMSLELKSRDVAKLVKQNRHYKSKTIISSQYIHDIDPQSRKQIDYAILFGGHSKDKLEIIFKDLDLWVSFEEFVRIYHDATKEKYNFLYIDTNNCIFRKNFNQVFVIHDEK